jgi:signal transduction histidine kinase
MTSLFSRFNFKQRYNLFVFSAVFMASCLLIYILYSTLFQYAYDYTSQYWKNYAIGFAETAKPSLVLESYEGGSVVVENLVTDKNIKLAAIYKDNHKQFAATGRNGHCPWGVQSFREPLFVEAESYWCFSTPINHQGVYIGNVELAVSNKDFVALIRKSLVTSALTVFGFAILIYSLISLISGKFTSIIVEMVDVLKYIGQGGRERRAHFTGTQDIEMMKDVFNDMLNKIELNEKILEQEVKNRTNELKFALEGSEAANVYKSQIMALVTHEMKTPLHATIGFLQTVQKTIAGDIKHDDIAQIRGYISRALKRSFELKAIIENILLQGQLEANSFIMNYQKTRVKSIVDECLEKAAPLKARNRNQVAVQGDDIEMVTDKEALSHIISNLVTNAYKFTVGGDILVKWETTSNQLKLEVSDTGCGIAVKYQEKIFEPFWQEDMGLGRKYGGHGLGLSIAKQMVQKMDGNITVTPNNGKGTIFTVTLPYPKGQIAHLRAV